MPSHIIVETKGRVGIVRLNRPQVLNALNKALVAELNAAVAAFDADSDYAILVTWNRRRSPPVPTSRRWTRRYSMPSSTISAPRGRHRAHRKPVVAAVASFALGGGRGAMQADLTVAADSSGSRRSSSASSRAMVARSGSPTQSARRRRWI